MCRPLLLLAARFLGRLGCLSDLHGNEFPTVTPYYDPLRYPRKLHVKLDQLDVTRFIISPFIAQHVSNVSTSIFRTLRLTVDLFHMLYCSGSMCVGVTVWFGWVVWYPYAG